MPDANREAREQIRAAAQQALGLDRPTAAQERALVNLLAGHDTLAILPTGAGKSAIYQIAGYLVPGVTLVVSPLIALQQDQAESLAESEAGDVAVVNSLAPKRSTEEALEAVERGDVEFLFLAPEQLRSEAMLRRLQAIRPSLFVVDEAHSISEWGHDFRPDYLLLGSVVEALGHPAVLALTATASEPVEEEIIERLSMRRPAVVRSGIDRPNIWLGVQRFDDARRKLEALVADVLDVQKPGIVYVATRRHAEEVATALNEAGIKSDFYHATLPRRRRESVQAEFMEDRLQVIVATKAFGLGIDKPNVRFVYHFDVSDSLDSYYQEVGRAGRDGEPAAARLFYEPGDLGLHRFFAGGRLRDEDIETVLAAIGEGVSRGRAEIEAATGFPARRVARILNQLLDTGALRVDAKGRYRLRRHTDFEEQVELAEEAQEQRSAYLNSRVDMMRAYAETSDCRRRNLLSYFGESIDPCHNCDNCDAGLANGEDEVEVELIEVEHEQWGPGRLLRRDGERATVLFESVGYKTLDLETARERGLLRFSQALTSKTKADST